MEGREGMEELEMDRKRGEGETGVEREEWVGGEVAKRRGGWERAGERVEME